MTATSPVSTAQLRMRISRHLKNHGERLVQSPDGRWCVVNAHDGLVVRGQHFMVVGLALEIDPHMGAVCRR